MMMMMRRREKTRRRKVLNHSVGGREGGREGGKEEWERCMQGWWDKGNAAPKQIQNAKA